MYFLAVVCPPLAVLLCGKPFQALLNVPLCFLGWIPAAVHAWSLVSAKEANDRQKIMLQAMGVQTQVLSQRR